MNEPTLLDRALMLVKTLAGTVAWIVALLLTLVRGKVSKRSIKS